MGNLQRRSLHRVEYKSDGLTQLATGGIAVPAVLGRTGVLDYATATGSVIREYRSIEEVSDPASLQSLKNATVTVRHPAEGKEAVTSEIWRDVAVGHVGEDVRMEGDLIVATLYIQDADTVQAIINGDLIDISPGYLSAIHEEPGVAEDGTGYDAVQRRIRYNHVALLPAGEGRQGPRVSLRVDSNSAVVIDYRVDMDEDKLKALVADMLPGMMPDMETLQESMLGKLKELLPELLKAELAGMQAESPVEDAGDPEMTEDADGELPEEPKTDEMSEEDLLRSDSVKRRLEVVRAFERATGETADLDKPSVELLKSAAEALELQVRSDSVDRLLGAVEAASEARKAAGVARVTRKPVQRADAAESKSPALTYEDRVRARHEQIVKAGRRGK